MERPSIQWPASFPLQASSCQKFVNDQNYCDHDQDVNDASKVRKGKIANQPSNDQ